MVRPDLFQACRMLANCALNLPEATVAGLVLNEYQMAVPDGNDGSVALGVLSKMRTTRGFGNSFMVADVLPPMDVPNQTPLAAAGMTIAGVAALAAVVVLAAF